MTVPAWVEDAIFYQIFPDRFAKGDPNNDPPNFQPWGSRPTTYGFQGGQLRGIINKFDYLLDLGINAIYLNPIFLASSNHRYNTTDYYQIDPKLGNLKDFQSLLELAHQHNVHIILDGVFNHCGRGFFAFNDILENQRHSPYRDWFHVSRFPVNAYSRGQAKSYLGWWGMKSLPKFNTSNPAVRRYLLDVAHYWIELGADGWRLDVPNEIDDDSFWAEFRHVVRSANPDAYILGEIWDGSPRWVGDTHCDGLMNYPIREAVLDFLTGKSNSDQLAEKVERYLNLFPLENTRAMYNLLGSHDTVRVLTCVGKDLDKAKLAFLFIMTYPGAPAVYYGDEIGMEGEKDPDCRRAFPWDTTIWNAELRTWVKMLIHLRRQTPALRHGEFHRMALDVPCDRIYAFTRVLDEQAILVLLNASPERQKISLDLHNTKWTKPHAVRSLLDSRKYEVVEGKLHLKLPANGAMILLDSR